jgi:MoaA/NifB/PqqE/SkfB family radical SAM enzyme
MNEHIIEKLPHNIYSIWFSLDSLKQKLYNKIRKGSDFNLVIKNIKLLRKLRPEIPIHIQSVVMKRNIKELPNFIKFAKKLNATVNFVYPVIMLPEMYKEHIHLYKESKIYLKKAEELAKKLNVKLFSKPLQPEMGYKYVWCTEPWRVPFISLNGNIFSCCFMYRVPNPIKSYSENYCGVNIQVPLKNYIMGNIYRTPFKKIWNGAEYKLLRRTVKETQVHKKITIEQLNEMRRNMGKERFSYCRVCLWRWGCAC